VLLVFWIAWITLLVLVRLQHPELDHGTMLSDSDVVSGGVYADEHGLLSTWGFPVNQTYRAPGAEPWLYVTYPPGRLWVHQLGKALGLSGRAGSRVLPMLSTALASLLAALLAFQLTRSAAVAALTTFFFSFNQLYAFHFDSLSEGLRQLTLVMALVGWLGFEGSQDGSRRRAWLALAVAGVLLDAWYTLEHLIFVPLFVVVRAAWSRDREKLGTAALVVGVVGLAVATRFAHVVGALGLEESIALFAGKAAERIGVAGGVTIMESLPRILPRLGLGQADRLGNPSRLPILAPAVLVPALALALIAFLRRRENAFGPIRAALAGGLLLTVVAMHWPLLMTQHAMIHHHTTLGFLPGIALLLAGLAAVGLTGTTRRFRRTAAALSIALVVGFASEMRHSRTLNLLLPMSRAATAFNHYRSEQVRTIRAAAPVLAGAKRVIIPGAQPNIGALLELPFERAGDDSLSGMGVADYYWLEAAETGKVSEALGLYGFPLRFGRPLESWLVFHGAGRAGVTLGLGFAGGFEISRADLVPTIGSPGATLQLVVRGDPAGVESIELQAELEEAEEMGAAPPPQRSRVRLSNGALFSGQIPSRSGARVRLRILDEEGAVLRPASGHTALPGGVELDANWILLDLPKLFSGEQT
jgi:hypothetical protein